MAYRKTEKVLAQLEARRASIIAAAIDVAAKYGLEGMTTDAVAFRAGIAVGLIYKYFPDKVELVAAVVQHVLQRDLAAVKQCGSLADALSVIFNRFAQNYRLMSAIGQQPVYREGMKRDLARLIRATEPAESSAVLAAAAYGSIYEAAGIGPRVEPALTKMLLKGLGVPSRAKAPA